MATAPSRPTLPRYQGADPAARAWSEALVARLEAMLADLALPVPAQPYSTTNVTASRTLDPTTATAGQVAQVLGTVIGDLRKGNVLP